MLIEKLIRKIKNDPDYRWDNAHTFKDLVFISWRRFNQMRRGIIAKSLFGNAKGLVFIGKNVRVHHKHLFSAGKNLILEDYVSIDALSANGIQFGDDVSIARNSILFCTGVIAQKGKGIKIGNRTGISARAYIAGQGGVTIGDDVIMGPNVQIFSENHNFNDLDKTIKSQGVTKTEVTIGDNCWIGASAIILAGVTLGNGCVVAAGSIVNKSFPDNAIIAGAPAKLIKTRVSDEK